MEQALQIAIDEIINQAGFYPQNIVLTFYNPIPIRVQIINWILTVNIRSFSANVTTEAEDLNIIE